MKDHPLNKLIKLALTKDISDCISIILITSLFKYTNQIVVGGFGTKLLFPLLQRFSPMGLVKYE